MSIILNIPYVPTLCTHAHRSDLVACIVYNLPNPWVYPPIERSWDIISSFAMLKTTHFNIDSTMLINWEIWIVVCVCVWDINTFVQSFFRSSRNYVLQYNKDYTIIDVCLLAPVTSVCVNTFILLQDLWGYGAKIGEGGGIQICVDLLKDSVAWFQYHNIPFICSFDGFKEANQITVFWDFPLLIFRKRH